MSGDRTKALRRMVAAVLCLMAASLAACTPPPSITPAAPTLRLTQMRFTDLAGWATADLAAGMSAFVRSCRKFAEKADGEMLLAASYAATAGDWRAPCAEAVGVANDPVARRQFFERGFVPYRISRGEAPEGLFTGYYEPELRGSRTKHGPYQTPLYGVPSDLVTIDLGQFREALRGQRLAGRVAGSALVPYAPRAEIVQKGLPAAQALVFVDDPVDAFFLHVQGSGRIVLDDGSVVRAAYAGQNGHPYTAIGAVLIEMGELQREQVSMQTIRTWLAAHPDRAAALLDRNASYVFFRVNPLGDPALGANGAEGVPLTPEASLAVDITIHPLGVPLWLETNVPGPQEGVPDRRFTRLVVAQDTGGAIRGPVRGDVYWGFGAGPGSIAGRMRGTGTLTVLLPRMVAARLGPRAEFPGATAGPGT
jgi:membrane-bound lytic murein transglycosylase A